MTDIQDPWATKSRSEDEFAFQSGQRRHRVRVLSKLTPDDLMMNLAKAEMHRIITGEDRSYFPEARMVDYLLRSKTSVRGG